MLRIRATQSTCYQDPGYLNYEEAVGFFPIDKTLPAFVPQRVQLVANGLNTDPVATEAWVAHDGQGKVAGFPIGRGWENECENPSWALSPANPDGFGYNDPDDCEADIPV